MPIPSCRVAFRRSFLGYLTATALLALSPLFVVGATAAEPAGPVAGQGEAVALLARVGEAWRTGNFRGRVMYVRGNRMDSMQVLHALIDGVEHERISHLDETASEIIRRGAETVCVHPDARLTRFDLGNPGAPFPAVSLPATEIARVYELRLAGPSRISGRSADRLDIHPRDGWRYGYRLWIDRDSRLPLRYEVAGRKGQVIESAEFIDLETAIVVPREMFLPPPESAARTLRIRRLEAPTGKPVAVLAPTWLPPGFRITGGETQQAGEEGAPVSVETWSDGLATFTLFHEPAAAGTRPAARQVGPTVAVSGLLDAGPGGRFLVTLVGEIPAATAVKVVEGVRLAPPATRQPGKTP